MMFASPGEVAFLLFGIVPIYYYGIFMALSMMLGVFTARTIAGKFYPAINPDVVYDIAPHIIIGAIIGARLYYCLLSWKYYSLHLTEIVELWHGGISIHGAIIGGLLAGILYAKRHKLPILKLCDIFSYGLVLGQALGRWGNFFNSEAFGRPTECFLKLYIPIYKRPIEYLQYNYFHPTFLYESVLDVCIFLILFFGVRRLVNFVIARKSLTAEGKKTTEAISYDKTYDGAIFFSYLILYSIARIIVEHYRIDSVLNIHGIPVAQIVSAVALIIGAVGLLAISKK
jgi:phosphatidylglycerol:prolipoprotein diacylglycerol transferase